MTLKEEFIQKIIKKECSLSPLCREYGISRKTAYKWIKRFEEEGSVGLEDRSKRPTKVEVTSCRWVELILETRNKFRVGRKLRYYLLNQ